MNLKKYINLYFFSYVITINGFKTNFKQDFTFMMHSCTSCLDSDSTGTWLPIGSKSSLPPSSGTPIKIANQNYVIWKNPKTDSWSLVKDVCPHRLAPLSQGRIDEETGCIECPYHGWQFSETGKCVKIPQSKKGEIGKNVESVEVIETGDILWGKFELENANFNKRPDIVFPELKNVKTCLTRELPYSFDFMVENFMDPAHIPFAHHGLQGVRSDGIDIPMQVLTSKEDSNELEIHFTDRIMGKMRTGIVSFTSPTYYHFRTLNATNQYNIQLMALLTPVSLGVTRIHLVFFGANTPNLFPKWISHSFGNKFLETDVWLHNCEIAGNKIMKSENKTLLESYNTPTTSDIGPVIWRKWWQNHMSHIPIYSNNNDNNKIKELTPKQQRDRTKHIDSCIHCQTAIRRAKALKSLSVTSLFFIKPFPLLSTATFIISRFISTKILDLIYGETMY